MLATDTIPAPVAGALRQTWDRARRRVLPPRCSHGACRSRRLANLWTAKSPLWFRGSWFCSPSCAEPAIHRYLAQLAWAPLPPALPPHRVPLGLLLLSRGDVSESQLQLALDAQRQNQARKIGEWLQLLRFGDASFNWCRCASSKPPGSSTWPPARESSTPPWHRSSICSAAGSGPAWSVRGSCAPGCPRRTRTTKIWHSISCDLPRFPRSSVSSQVTLPVSAVKTSALHAVALTSGSAWAAIRNRLIFSSALPNPPLPHFLRPLRFKIIPTRFAERT